jgi:hypothetical protein
MSTGEDRAAVVAGYRLLADLLEQHPELPIPYHGPADAPGGGTEITLYMLSSERTAFVDAVRCLPGRLDKAVTNDGGDTDTFRVKARLEGITIEVVAYRDTVCKRVVIGSRAVTKTVPDPNVTVPVVEVTEVVEDVEWVCGPLLREQVTS